MTHHWRARIYYAKDAVRSWKNDSGNVKGKTHKKRIAFCTTYSFHETSSLCGQSPR